MNSSKEPSHSSTRSAILAVVLALNVASANAQLTLSCPIDSSVLAYLDTPERVVFGKRARDWTDSDLEEIRAKFLACSRNSRDVSSVREANVADFESRAMPQARQALRRLADRKTNEIATGQPPPSLTHRANSPDTEANAISRPGNRNGPTDDAQNPIVKSIRAKGCAASSHELVDLRAYSNEEVNVFGKPAIEWTLADVATAEVTLNEQLQICAQRERYTPSLVQNAQRTIQTRIELFRSSLPIWQAEYRKYAARRDSERTDERNRIAKEDNEMETRRAATRAACDVREAEDIELAKKKKDGLALCQRVLASGKYPAQVRARTIMFFNATSMAFDDLVCEHVPHGATVDYVKPILGKEKITITRKGAKVEYEVVPFDQIGMRDTTWVVTKGAINGEAFDSRKDHPYMIGEAMRRALYSDLGPTVPSVRRPTSLDCAAARTQSAK